MSPNGSLLGFLPPLKALLGPWGVAIAIAAAAGWAAHGAAQTVPDLAVTVARLDSSTVKRDTFALFQQEIRAELRLVRRYVCRQSPDLCP